MNTACAGEGGTRGLVLETPKVEEGREDSRTTQMLRCHMDSVPFCAAFSNYVAPLSCHDPLVGLHTELERLVRCCFGRLRGVPENCRATACSLRMES